MKRIDGENDRYAIKHDMPALKDRTNPDSVAALDRWILWLPGEHPFWNVFFIAGIALRDFSGVPPAKKKFAGATHQIIVGASDPVHDEIAIKKGGLKILHPLNYEHQFVATDPITNSLAEHLVIELLNHRYPAESSGIRGSRDHFERICNKFLEEKSRGI